MSQGQTPPGWYHAEGDPPGTSRYWDGSQWIGDPVQTGPAPAPAPQPDPYGQAQPDPAAQAPQTGQPGAVGPPPGADYANTGFPGTGAAPPADFGTPGGFTSQPTLASPGARIGGRIIDGIIWIILGIISAIPLIVVSVDDFIDSFNSGATTAPDINVGLLFITGVINTALVAGYEVFMNLSGGTLGKRAISAKIVKEDGSPLDLNAAMMRMALYVGLAVVGIFAGVIGSSALDNLQQLANFLVFLAGLIMLFADSRRQTPWDKVGKTIVVTS